MFPTEHSEEFTKAGEMDFQEGVDDFDGAVAFADAGAAARDDDVEFAEAEEFGEEGF